MFNRSGVVVVVSDEKSLYGENGKSLKIPIKDQNLGISKSYKGLKGSLQI